MTSRDFAYWLQGFFEIKDLDNDPKKTELTMEQVECIKKHLNMVFFHEIDPSMGGKEHQGKLDQIHHGVESLQQSPEDQILGPTADHQLPDWMVKGKMTEEELDEMFGKGVRPRC